MRKHGFISGFLFFFVQMISEKTNASGAFAYTKMTVKYRYGTIFLNKWRTSCTESRTVYRRGRNEKTLCFLLGGCGRAKKEDAESGRESAGLVIGFSQLGSESAWRLGNTASMENAAREHGISLVVNNGMQKQENQIAAIRSFIAYQVDVIVFAPIVEEGWANVLQEAKEAGIPVIMMDRLINIKDSDLYDAYIGPDHYLEGVNAARFLMKKAEEMQTAHDSAAEEESGKIRIAELSGTEGSSPMISRYKGFHDLIDNDDRFEILETVSGDFLRSKGRECMRSLLKKYPGQIDVLYSHNDAMTLGAIEVMEEQGIEPGKDIVIISVDGEQAAVDLLKEGKINCVVECSPMLGEAVMDLAEKIVSGQDYPRVTHPAEGCFTEYDDLSSLAPRGY